MKARLKLYPQQHNSYVPPTPKTLLVSAVIAASLFMLGNCLAGNIQLFN